MSAIKETYIMFNGQKVVAHYDERTKTWTATTNAPANSSWSQPDHVYKVEIHAVDAANNKATMTSADPTYGNQLKIRVLEKSKPTATIVSPTQGSVLGASEQDIVLEMSDAGGSGLNETTVVFTVNGKSHAGDLSFTDHESKRRATYHATGLNDGQNTITFQVTDNDGNVSELATTTFVVSTTAPSLKVDTPTEGLITNSNRLTVTGSTTPGSNAVTITDVVAEATTVDSGGTIKITFKVTDAA